MRGRRSPPADLRGGSIARCSEEESFCKTAADELRHLWSREGDMDERPIDSPDLAWTDITANRSSMMSDTVWISIAKATIEDGDIAVSKAACSGPDIWVDPQIGDAFFLSDALGTTPKKAKADKGFLPTQMPGALTLVDGGRYGRRSEFRLQLSSRAYSGSSRESAP